MEINSISQGRQTAQDLSFVVTGSDITVNTNTNTDSITNSGDKKVNEKNVQKAVNKLNDFLEDKETHAEYSYNENFKYDIMIKIIDDKTGEVVQEIPSKKILDMIAKMCEMVGILVDQKA